MPEGPEARIVWPEDALWPQGGYANTIAVNHTPWDFTIYVGHVALPPITADHAEGRPSMDIPVTPVAQVTIPPVAAAQLAAILQEQIAKYVTQYGPIGGAPEAGLG
jgi:hypothetical protein